MKLQVKENPFVHGKYVLMNEQGTHIVGQDTGMPLSFTYNGLAEAFVRSYESKRNLHEWHAFIPLDAAQAYFKAEAARERKSQRARERRERMKQELIDAVLAQIVRDVEAGDLTAIEELIKAAPLAAAVHYLPEEQQTNEGE